MIRSYDIFDTCLTRRVAEPAEVFDLMAERVGLGEDFRFRRQEAEIEAERRRRDATLEEIYRILGQREGWSTERQFELIEEELEEERRQLIPVPEMRDRIARLHEQDTSVHYVSDMYLPSRFLRELLIQHGFWQEGDMLWVSCEARKSKASGALFKELLAYVGGNTIEHTGNHLHADVRAADRAGLRGRAFIRANLTSHEQSMADWPLTLGSHWAGAAREARLAPGLSGPAHAIASVATGVAGPLLLAYVSWICDRALLHHLDRIYFLARDGQILRLLFEKVARARGIQIEARYLHASRIALRFPRAFPMTDADAAGVFQADRDLPLEVVALRLGIDQDQLISLLPSDFLFGKTIPQGHFNHCRTALASEDACRILNEVATRRKELLSEYLVQEGMTDGKRFGICDLGWAGSLQAALKYECSALGTDPDFPGFYLGLARLPAAEMQAEAYAFDYRQHRVKDIPWFVLAAEVFSQADHGSTTGFSRRHDGAVVPVLDDPDGDNPLVPDWLRIHQTGILGFVDGVIRRKALPDSPASLLRLVVQNMRHFSFQPSKQEAEAWGSCRFSSHGSASAQVPLAASPRTPVDLMWITGIRCFGAGNSPWPHGAAARLPQPFRSAATLMHRVRNRIKPLKW